MPDDITQYRRSGQIRTAPSPAEAPKAEPDTYAYQAFKLLDKGNGEFLSLERSGQLVRCMSYHGLVEILHDGEHGTVIALVFSFGPVVTIYGRNLSEAALGLCFRRIECLTEFDEKRWPLPADKSAPVIDSIMIEMRHNVADIEAHIGIKAE